MYLWSLFGHDLLGRPILDGITDNLANAMRAAETRLKDGRAFVCVIEEVQTLICVNGLEEHYAATGRRWNGRRDNSGGVHWRFSVELVGSPPVYSLPESLLQGEPDDSRGLVA